MNLKTKIRGLFARLSVGLIVLTSLIIVISGCSHPQISSLEELAAFDKAGPYQPQTDLDRLVQAKVPTDPYVVVAGDVLQLHMPAILYAIEAVPVNTLEVIQTHLCRVNDSGQITLPIIGQIPAAGKNLAEIEEAIVNAYYPKYVVDRPSVVAEVATFHTESVSIIGAVEAPGTYSLRHDEMSLIALLMKAGGIGDTGARGIRIKNALLAEEKEPFILPVKGMNIPFADVALNRGDIVEVEQIDPEVFTVVGLVNRPGAFAYPPEAEYNLLQALAFAGGTNAIADPQYVKVYRQKPDGEIIDATFKLNEKKVTSAAGVRIKPGDVVSVEQTDRTRTRLIFAQVVNVTFGVNAGVLYRYLQGQDVTNREVVEVK